MAPSLFSTWPSVTRVAATIDPDESPHASSRSWLLALIAAIVAHDSRADHHSAPAPSPAPGRRTLAAMVLYGIASAISRDIDDFASTRDDAERTLAAILRHEPSLAGLVWVEPVDLIGLCPN